MLNLQVFLSAWPHRGEGWGARAVTTGGTDRWCPHAHSTRRIAVRSRAANQPYRPALESIASLRPKVDLFFDKVHVNAPDVKIRQNRLTLLHTLLAEFSTIADFSEIVTNT